MNLPQNVEDVFNDLNARFPGAGTVTIKQIAEFTGVCRQTVAKEIQSHKLGAKLGGAWLVPKMALARYLTR